MQTDPTPNGPRFLGKYEVLARLDSGGMAEIFLARSRAMAGFEKLVVLKRILPHLAAEEEFVSMFLDEAKTTVALSHGNIVQVFDMGRGEDGDYFIAMEYVAGKNLRRYCKRALEHDHEAVDPPLAAWVASEILRGLDYAHRRTDAAGKPLGIVHRDLSPHNILISYEGEVKVADFGIAKAAGKVVRTETGLIRGKANYMSPEQARAEELDGRSDLFSVGTLLYELLTGKLPFDGENSEAILRNILNGAPEPPSAKRGIVPPALDRIVMKALSLEPSSRYATADLFLKDLVGFLGAAGAVIGPRDLAARMSSLFADDIEKERTYLAALPRAAEPPPTPPPMMVETSDHASGASRTAAGSPGATQLPTKPLAPEEPVWRRVPGWAQAGALVGIAGFLIAGSWYAIGGAAVSPTATATATAVAHASPTATHVDATPSPTGSATHLAVATPTRTARPTPRPTHVAVATPVATPAAARKGRLSIQSDVWAYVYLDEHPVALQSPPPSTVNGQLVSATPILGFETSAGPHTVRVARGDLSGVATVNVPAGGDASLCFRAEGKRLVRGECHGR